MLPAAFVVAYQSRQYHRVSCLLPFPHSRRKYVLALASGLLDLLVIDAVASLLCGVLDLDYSQEEGKTVYQPAYLRRRWYNNVSSSACTDRYNLKHKEPRLRKENLQTVCTRICRLGPIPSM